MKTERENLFPGLNKFFAQPEVVSARLPIEIRTAQITIDAGAVPKLQGLEELWGRAQEYRTRNEPDLENPDGDHHGLHRETASAFARIGRDLAKELCQCGRREEAVAVLRQMVDFARQVGLRKEALETMINTVIPLREGALACPEQATPAFNELIAILTIVAQETERRRLEPGAESELVERVLADVDANNNLGVLFTDFIEHQGHGLNLEKALSELAKAREAFGQGLNLLRGSLVQQEERGRLRLATARSNLAHTYTVEARARLTASPAKDIDFSSQTRAFGEHLGEAIQIMRSSAKIRDYLWPEISRRIAEFLMVMSQIQPRNEEAIGSFLEMLAVEMPEISIGIEGSQSQESLLALAAEFLQLSSQAMAEKENSDEDDRLLLLRAKEEYQRLKTGFAP